MKNTEEKILKLRDKKLKLEEKVDLLNVKLLELQKKCRHPTTKKVLGDTGVACVICTKIL